MPQNKSTEQMSKTQSQRMAKVAPEPPQPMTSTMTEFNKDPVVRHNYVKEAPVDNSDNKTPPQSKTDLPNLNMGSVTPISPPQSTPQATAGKIIAFNSGSELTKNGLTEVSEHTESKNGQFYTTRADLKQQGKLTVLFEEPKPQAQTKKNSPRHSPGPGLKKKKTTKDKRSAFQKAATMTLND